MYRVKIEGHITNEVKWEYDYPLMIYLNSNEFSSVIEANTKEGWVIPFSEGETENRKLFGNVEVFARVPLGGWVKRRGFVEGDFNLCSQVILDGVDVTEGTVACDTNEGWVDRYATTIIDPGKITRTFGNVTCRSRLIGEFI